MKCAVLQIYCATMVLQSFFVFILVFIFQLVMFEYREACPALFPAWSANCPRVARSLLLRL